MNSQTKVIVFVLILVVAINNVNCKSKYFRPPEECKNEPERNQENCLKNYCQINTGTFICKAYKCRQGNTGNDIIQNVAKLKCIKDTCKSHSSELVCRELKICNAKKTGLGGLFRLIKCILKIFQE